MTNKDWAGAVLASIDACKKSFGNAADDKKASSEMRADAAKRYVRCLEDYRGKVSLYAAMNGTATGVSEAYVAEYSAAVEKMEQRSSEDLFKGWNFGVGIGFSHSNRENVDSAVVINNVVTVTSSKKQEARIFLESHYFPEGWCNSDPLNVRYGCGPFLAVATSQTSSPAGVGFGLMWGMKTSKTKKEGWSIGVGAILDNGVKDLAAGFKAGEPPPAGQTTVITEEKARWSKMFFVTRIF